MLSLFIPTRWAAAGLIGVAFACTFASAITGWMAPKLNWDLLAYAALVMSWLGTVDPHAAVYADATAFAQTHGLVATFQASSLRDGFQSVMAGDAAAFAEQFPFYAVRPLYVLTLLGFTVIGGSATGATVLLSVVSTLACTLLVLTYAIYRLGAVAGSLVGTLFALAPSTFTVSRFSTPDAMLMLLVCTAFLLLSERRLLAGALVLLAGSLVRSDLVLLNVLLAAALVGLRGSEPWRTRLLAAGVLLLSLPVIKMIEAGVGNYGYVALWHYTFEGFVPHPGALASVPLQLRPFLGAVLNGVKENLGNGGLWSALLLLGSAAWLLFHAKVFWRDARTALLLAALFYLPARLFLFPSHDLRLMAPLIGGLTIVFIAVAGFVLASSTAASGAQVGILKWPVCDEVA